MSNTHHGVCCTEPHRYIVHYEDESPAILCETHFADKENLRCATFIHDVKLDKHLEIPFQ